MLQPHKVSEAIQYEPTEFYNNPQVEPNTTGATFSFEEKNAISPGSTLSMA